MKSKDIKDTRAEKAEEQVKPKEESEAQTELDREAMGDDKYIEALEERIGALMAETTPPRNLTLRLQAGFDNYRKRNAGPAPGMKTRGES